MRALLDIDILLTHQPIDPYLASVDVDTLR